MAQKPNTPKKKAAPSAEAPEEQGSKLTPKMEAFAACVASGMSLSDAYRSAYDATKMAPATVHKRASELMRRGEVRGRTDELRREATEHLVWTRGESLQVLAEIARDTEGVAKMSERVAAVKELNAMHGFNAPQKLDIGLRDLEPIEDESWL